MFKIYTLLAVVALSAAQVCDASLCNCNNNTCASCILPFMYPSSNSCLLCPHQCSSCSSASNCTGCQSNYYLSNWVCQACPGYCSSCNPTCLSCMSGYSLQGGNCVACTVANVLRCESGGLVLSCAQGFWQNGNSCSPCRQFCLLCSSPSNCLKCQVGYFVAISFGSYCQMCTSGCQTCTASGCSQCHYNYQLTNGQCSDITLNCSSIPNCRYCTATGAQLQCYACIFPYFISTGGCIKGSSLLCQNGATGPQYYQCLDSCSPYGYLLQIVGGHSVCLPLPRVATVQQIYLNAYAPIFQNGLYKTSRETIYYDSLLNSMRTTDSVLSFSLVLPPYYKIVMRLKLISSVAIGQTLNCSVRISDNSSKTQVYNYSITITANPEAIYFTIHTKQLKDKLLNITIVSNTNNQTVPVVGLSECLTQAYPCPNHCLLCYNAELCSQCLATHFNTPPLICDTQCTGYLQLYLPQGNPLNYTHKQCVLNCPPNFYSQQSNHSFICQPCASTCLTCLSLSQCLTCHPGLLYYQINFICLSSCPPTHHNISNICTLCSPPCATCTNQTHCLTCSIGYYSNSTCSSSCPTGTFPNSTDSICTQCLTPCASCEGSPSFCLSCIHPYLLMDSTCLPSCPSSLYYPDNLTCQGCLPPCRQCLNSTACLSCLTGYLSNLTCLSSCPSGYYPYALDSTCKLCLNGCLSCQSQTLCTSCPNLSNLFSFQCLSICPQGTYSSNNVCQDCIQPCSGCLNQTYCTSCSIGYLSSLSPGSCLFTCQIGYYSSQLNSSCLPCSPQCFSCISTSSTCHSCTSPLLLQGNSCLGICNSGYYNISATCLLCSFPCLTCTGTDYYCLSCTSPYILINNTCLTECPQFSFLNGGSCTACIVPCQTCISSSACLSCVRQPLSQTYLLANSCLSACPSGYFSDSVSLSCRPCSYPCLSCISQSLCLSCVTGFLNINTSTCQFCSGAWFGNTTTKQCQLCSSTLANCQQCSSSSQCTLCGNSTYLYNSTCISLTQCLGIKGYYSDITSFKCAACISPCTTCANSSHCLTCTQGLLLLGTCLNQCPYTHFPSQNSCQPCSQFCLTCSNSTQCLTCNASGSYPLYFSSTLSCIATQNCSSGYYIDTSFGWDTCSPCSPPCLSCINTSYCLSCTTGLLLDGSCKSVCPSGYYIETTLITPSCLLCSRNCSKCSSAASLCTSCPSNLYLKSNTCVVDCGSGYYIDSLIYQCFQCVSPCLSCSSASQCLSCTNSSYYLYQNQCLSTCPSGTYPLNSTCMQCPSVCLTCTSTVNLSIECTQCGSGFYMSILQSGTCLANCGLDEYGDNLTQHCYTCISPCSSCSSAIHCLTCLSNYLLVNTQCLAISRCPNGYYLLGRQCVRDCGVGLWAIESSALCAAQCLSPSLKVYSAQWQCLLSCPSNFRVDINYTCTPCLPCHDLLQVKVQLKSIFNVLYAKLTFSTPANLQLLTDTSLSLSLAPFQTRLLQQSNISYQITTVNIDALWIKLDIKSSIRNSIFRVQFRDYYLVGTPLQTLTLTTTIKSFDLYDQQQENSAKQFQTYSEGMSALMLVLFLLDLILNSGHLSYLIIDYYQLLFMMLFLSIDYPPPLNHFLYGFRYSHYLFLPQIFQKEASQQYSSQTPDKFGVVVPDVHFLNNAAPTLIIIITAVSVLVLSKLLQLMLTRLQKCRSSKVVNEDDESSGVQQQGRCMRLLGAMVSRFKWNYFNDITYTVYFSLMLFSFSQLYDLSWRSQSASSLISIILAFVVMVLGVLLPLLLGYMLHGSKDSLTQESLSHQKHKIMLKQKENSQSKEVNQHQSINNNNQLSEGHSRHSAIEQQALKHYQVLAEYKCFVSGIKLRVSLGFYHIPIKYAKKLIFACLIVYYSQYPSLVLGTAIASCLLNILISLCLRPHRLSFELVLLPVFNLLYLLVFATILILQLPLLALSQSQKLNASYLAIGLCILLSLLLAVHNLTVNVVQVIKYCCQIDYFASYYQTEYVCTTEEGDQVGGQQQSCSPLRKEGGGGEVESMGDEVESGSVLSGLDIYLSKDQAAPKFLIKCLKYTDQPQQPQLLKEDNCHYRTGFYPSQQQHQTPLQHEGHIQGNGASEAEDDGSASNDSEVLPHPKIFQGIPTLEIQEEEQPQ